MTDPGATDVAARFGFEQARLEAWCARTLPGFRGPAVLSTFAGGNSNPTFMVTDSGGRRWVVRKKPAGVALQSAHMVEREYRVMKALQGTGVPVPPVHALCEDESVLGTPFFAMDCVEGRVLRDPALPGCTPAERAAIFGELNRVLAALHQVDYAAHGLADYGKPGNYYERQYARWQRQYRATEYDRIPEMELLLEKLPARIPRDDSTAIAHGDFRLENVIFHPSEPRIVAVLDWELSTLGHPVADLGYNCLMYHTRSQVFGTVAHLDLQALGIPSEGEYVAAYCRRTGRGAIEDFGFYVGFALFRLAAIAQGREKRRREGVTLRVLPPGNETIDFARQALAALGWA